MFVKFPFVGPPAQVWTCLGGIQPPSVPYSNLVAARQLEPPPCPLTLLTGSHAHTWTGLDAGFRDERFRPFSCLHQQAPGLGRVQQSELFAAVWFLVLFHFFKFQSGLF